MVWDKVGVSVNILGVLLHHFILYPLLPLLVLHLQSHYGCDQNLS